ncbi:heterokaryon incompatibility Het-C [Hymenopellis radicata]|nr:heterokaryon incompatibility Het-C [Hymenopellis radicata]
MPLSASYIVLVFATLTVLLPGAYAFGAGDIPQFAYLHDKAFRHGDIENVLEEVVKSVAAGGFLALAKMTLAKDGPRFSREDIKKVYFGNWLRDYSQAMDIAGLSKLSAETIQLIVAVLGFTVFGYATEEFEINAERLGVYLPVEHIDNPKGYAESEPKGDARAYNPDLRPPVDPRELYIDPRNGMKCYIATEDQGWDSSTAHIRRVFIECIEYGRRSEGHRGADLDNAYRLLGKGLHTMEDLMAHSNWLEIALRKLGFTEIFCHVGDAVLIEAPTGEFVPPLVTGTFGGADFVHSLLGEATDHLSQASVTALQDAISQQSTPEVSGKLADIRAILKKLGMGSEMEQAEQMQAQSSAYHFDPDNIAPPEVQKQLLDLLHWRDNVFRVINKTIDLLGLSELFEAWINAINAYVYTTLAPYLTPILSQTTAILGEGSKAIIDSDDQYEVFDNPVASDPSHSLLSKDHFGLILNEPAGMIAKLIVVHSVEIIVQAWSDKRNPNEAIDVILEAFHHPYFASTNSGIQQRMLHELKQWVRKLGPEREATLTKLTKESVREHTNMREGSGFNDVGCGHNGRLFTSTTLILKVDVERPNRRHHHQHNQPLNPAPPPDSGDWSTELADRMESTLHVGHSRHRQEEGYTGSSINYMPSYAFPEPMRAPPPPPPKDAFYKPVYL